MASKNGSCAARSIFFNCHQNTAHHQIANQVLKKNSPELEKLEPRTVPSMQQRKNYDSEHFRRQKRSKLYLNLDRSGIRLYT